MGLIRDEDVGTGDEESNATMDQPDIRGLVTNKTLNPSGATSVYKRAYSQGCAE